MTTPELERVLGQVAAWLQEARSVLFITGAGISADSGLPTYRGVGGLYGDIDTEDGLPIEEAVSGPVFRRRPALTWKYLHQMERGARGAEPNLAHRFIAGLEARIPRVVVLTQNVDGLHQAAGSSQVIAIHGNLHELRCTECSWRSRVPDFAALEALPLCPSCEAVARPDVVLFEELLPPREVAALQDALARGFELVFAVGTTALFPYIAGPVVQAARSGVPTVEVNPEETQLSGLVAARLPLGAARAFEALGAAL